MGTVRSMLTKFPGFFFSGLNTIMFFNTVLISTDSYKQYMADTYGYNEMWQELVHNKTSTYEFVDGMPKMSLYVKFSDSIS
mmetsp:Transcript_34403/g.42477  ORF Transcript_34403/g.42477 Transcript_34403/m.42477 type:complete len:81 (+) Transcript_34403:1814-2056(+)